MKVDPDAQAAKIEELEQRLERLRKLFLDRPRNEKLIAAALLDSGHNHGAITAANRSSAAKRIESALREDFKRRAEGELTDGVKR